jgi:chromosome segregation ATPase
MDNSADLTQLQKQVAWLDNEHRNDKTLIAGLQNQLETLTTENSGLQSRLKEMGSELTRLSTLMARLDQFEGEINKINSETTRQLGDFKDSVNEIHIQTERHQQQISDTHSDITGVKKKIQNLESVDVNKALSERKEEESRLARLIEEQKSQLNEISRFYDEYQRTLRIVEENRRQDAKRVTDLQGEIASIRKRSDETRGKQDLVNDNMRKLEVRIKDLLDAESERREAQTAFVEKVNIQQVNRDRAFSEWKEHFDRIEKISTKFEEETAALAETHRSVKQSQSALDEVSQRFDRRINEITEVQRLNEDRFRQEWTTFKSDDQKRWSNYIISQDEQHREMNQHLDNLKNQLSSLEEALIASQETLAQLGRNETAIMQNLLTGLREGVDSHRNIFKE